MLEIKIMGQINIFSPSRNKVFWGKKKLINELQGEKKIKTIGNPGKLMMHVN